MEMTFTIKELIDFLEKENISFTLSGENNLNKSTSFTLASLHNILQKGIFYFIGTPDHRITGIRESVIISNQSEGFPEGNLVITVSQPQLVHYKLAKEFEKQYEPGIHPSSIVHPGAKIAASAHVGPYCVIGECVIGENVVLLGTITINHQTEIGNNTLIESHTVVGARGMAWIWDEQGQRVMQPQNGGVKIGSDCIIGTNITIVRGSLSENTLIGKGTVMAHGSKVGHGCVVGEKVHFANNVSLAGNAVIGNRVFLGSGCVVSSNVTIGEGCIVGAGAVVHKSIHETYCTVAGVPASVIRKNNFEQKPKGAPLPFKNTGKNE
jgi:UDP-3-O-[3-hydroxymyristoyl] glucosamine N-acyltransferase